MSHSSNQGSALANGGAPSTSAAHGLLQNSQLSGELKNLLPLLGAASNSGITLEQLLAASTSGKLPQLRSAATASTSHAQPQVAMATNPTTPTTSSSSSGSWGGRKRGRSFDLAEDNPKRRRSASYSARQSGEKQHNKGLRHFSQRVCEKVREKGTTTYNEVADELVKELSESERKTAGGAEVPIDHKNIRRRVYDALNVLMAMNIISKEKKEIRWIGLPTNSIQECQHIEAELAQAEERVQAKRTEVENLLVQILTFKNLMKRNRDRVASLELAHNSTIGLPFIIVNTSKKTTIDCSISSDKSEYVFNFDNTFELYNDIDILKKMGLDCGLHSGSFSDEDLRHAKAMLPKAFESTVDEIAVSKVPPVPTTVPVTPVTPATASTSALRPSPSLSLTSTPSLPPTPLPNFTASPNPSTLSPLAQVSSAVQGSPLTASQIAAALAQVRGTSSATYAAGVGTNSPGRSLCGGNPILPQVIPSPRAMTALMTNALRGTKPTVTARPLIFTPSTSSARAQLHSHCPTQTAISPLVKTAGNPMVAVPSSPPTIVPATITGSPLASKSPTPKIVTASKIPVTGANYEQLASLIQTLQQNSNLLKQLPLLSTTSASLSNGSSTSDDIVASASNVTGHTALGQTGTASILNGLAATLP